MGMRNNLEVEYTTSLRHNIIAPSFIQVRDPWSVHLGTGTPERGLTMKKTIQPEERNKIELEHREVFSID